MSRPSHRFRLDPAQALALLALLANVLFAGPVDRAAAAPAAGTGYQSALCLPSGATGPLAPVVPDAPSHDGGPCCTLGCPMAGTDPRGVPLEDQAAAWPLSASGSSAIIWHDPGADVGRPITLASAGPRGPPAGSL